MALGIGLGIGFPAAGTKVRRIPKQQPATSVVEEQAATTAEGKEGYTKLDNGQWVSTSQWNELTPEQQTKLQQAGVEGFMAWQVEQQAEFEANYVKLDTGDYISKIDFDKLTPEQQARIKSMGVEAYKAAEQTTFESDNVKLGTGEYISKTYFDELTPDQQAKLNTMGVESYNADNKRISDEFAAQHTKLDSGEYVDNGFYANLTPEQQVELNTSGVDAFNAHNAAVEAEFLAAHTKIATGEYVPNVQYSTLSEENKAKLNELGVEGFMAWQANQQAIFESQNVLLGTGEYVPKVNYETLTAEQQARIKEIGVSAFNEEQAAAVAEFGATHVKLNNGDYVLKTDYNALTPENQTKLMSMGVAAFTADQKAMGDAFLLATVKLPSGEYVSHTFYDPLTAAQKAELNSLGIDKFNAKYAQLAAEFDATHTKLATGEYVPNTQYTTLSEVDKAKLNSLGVAGFMAWQANQQAIFESQNILLSTGEYIPKADYAALSAENQARLMEIGVTAFNAEQQQQQATFEAAHTKLTNGDYVLTKEFKALTPENQTKLMTMGVAGFTADQKAMGDAFAAENVLLTSGEYVSHTFYDPLTAVQKAELNSLGIDKFNAKYAQLAAEFDATHTKIGTGEYVSNVQYNALTAEQKTKLNAEGVAAFEAWQDGLVKEYEATHVKLADGSYIDKKTYDTLSPEDQAKLKAIGVDAFNAQEQAEQAAFESTHVKLLNGEWVKKTDYAALDAASQTLLNQLGVDGFTAYQKRQEAEFIAAHVKLGTGEYVSLDNWNALSTYDKAYLAAYGVAQYQKMADARWSTFQTNNVQLSTGEWIEKSKYLELSQYDRALLIRIGTEAFMKEMGEVSVHIMQDTGVIWIYRPGIAEILGQGNTGWMMYDPSDLAGSVSRDVVDYYLRLPYVRKETWAKPVIAPGMYYYTWMPQMYIPFTDPRQVPAGTVILFPAINTSTGQPVTVSDITDTAVKFSTALSQNKIPSTSRYMGLTADKRGFLYVLYPNVRLYEYRIETGSIDTGKDYTPGVWPSIWPPETEPVGVTQQPTNAPVSTGTQPATQSVAAGGALPQTTEVGAAAGVEQVAVSESERQQLAAIAAAKAAAAASAAAAAAPAQAQVGATAAFSQVVISEEVKQQLAAIAAAVGGMPQKGQIDSVAALVASHTVVASDGSLLIQCDNGQQITKASFDAIDPIHQTQLIQLGISVVTVQMSQGDLMWADDFAALPPQAQTVVQQEGLQALDTSKMTGPQKFYKYVDLGFIPAGSMYMGQDDKGEPMYAAETYHQWEQAEARIMEEHFGLRLIDMMLEAGFSVPPGVDPKEYFKSLSETDKRKIMVLVPSYLGSRDEFNDTYGEQLQAKLGAGVAWIKKEVEDHVYHIPVIGIPLGVASSALVTTGAGIASLGVMAARFGETGVQSVQQWSPSPIIGYSQETWAGMTGFMAGAVKGAAKGNPWAIGELAAILYGGKAAIKGAAKAASPFLTDVYFPKVDLLRSPVTGLKFQSIFTKVKFDEPLLTGARMPEAFVVASEGKGVGILGGEGLAPQGIRITPEQPAVWLPQEAPLTGSRFAIQSPIARISMGLVNEPIKIRAPFDVGIRVSKTPYISDLLPGGKVELSVSRGIQRAGGSAELEAAAFDSGKAMGELKAATTNFQKVQGVVQGEGTYRALIPENLSMEQLMGEVKATPMEQIARIGAKEAQPYLKAASDLKAAQAKAMAADTKLVDTLVSQKKLTSDIITKTEQVSGMKGIDTGMQNMVTVSNALKKAWAEVDKNEVGSAGHIKAVDNVVSAQKALDIVRSDFEGRTAPRVIESPAAAWKPKLEGAENAVAKAQTELSAIEGRYLREREATGKASKESLADFAEASQTLRNAEIELSNLKAGMEAGQMPPEGGLGIPTRPPEVAPRPSFGPLSPEQLKTALEAQKRAEEAYYQQSGVERLTWERKPTGTTMEWQPFGEQFARQPLQVGKAQIATAERTLPLFDLEGQMMTISERPGAGQLSMLPTTGAPIIPRGMPMYEQAPGAPSLWIPAGTMGAMATKPVTRAGVGIETPAIMPTTTGVQRVEETEGMGAQPLEPTPVETKADELRSMFSSKPTPIKGQRLNFGAVGRAQGIETTPVAGDELNQGYAEGVTPVEATPATGNMLKLGQAAGAEPVVATPVAGAEPRTTTGVEQVARVTTETAPETVAQTGLSDITNIDELTNIGLEEAIKVYQDAITKGLTDALAKVAAMNAANVSMQNALQTYLQEENLTEEELARATEIATQTLTETQQALKTAIETGTRKSFKILPFIPDTDGITSRDEKFMDEEVKRKRYRKIRFMRTGLIIYLPLVKGRMIVALLPQGGFVQTPVGLKQKRSLEYGATPDIAKSPEELRTTLSELEDRAPTKRLTTLPKKKLDIPEEYDPYARYYLGRKLLNPDLSGAL